MESEHKIYRPTWELNSASSDRLFQSVCTVSQPLRQVFSMCIKYESFWHTSADVSHGRFSTSVEMF